MAKPKKKPEPPAEGDVVHLKGRGKFGVLRRIDPERNWCWVDWDVKGPLICHLHELERERDAIQSAT